MGRKPIRDQFFKEATITLKYECIERRMIGKEVPELVEVTTSAANITAWDSACDMCGSHGAIEVLVSECPVCGGRHSIDLESW